MAAETTSKFKSYSLEFTEYSLMPSLLVSIVSPSYPVSATSGRGEANWDRIIKLCNCIRDSVVSYVPSYSCGSRQYWCVTEFMYDCPWVRVSVRKYSQGGSKQDLGKVFIGGGGGGGGQQYSMQQCAIQSFCQ